MLPLHQPEQAVWTNEGLSSTITDEGYGGKWSRRCENAGYGRGRDPGSSPSDRAGSRASRRKRKDPAQRKHMGRKDLQKQVQALERDIHMRTRTWTQQKERTEGI